MDDDRSRHAQELAKLGAIREVREQRCLSERELAAGLRGISLATMGRWTRASHFDHRRGAWRCGFEDRALGPYRSSKHRMLAPIRIDLVVERSIRHLNTS